MKLLVLDSSGLVASVALIEDDRLIAEYTTGNKLTHSQTLLPMLNESLSISATILSSSGRAFLTCHSLADALFLSMKPLFSLSFCLRFS